jgi:hypothetical protein
VEIMNKSNKLPVKNDGETWSRNIFP